MLFVLDVGNTNAVLGVYGGEDLGKGPARLLAHWRVSSNRNQTVDEYGVLFRNLFLMSRIDPKEIKGIVISSVVPPIDSTLREVCEKYFQL
jgi:type III pantothenate kinase